MNLHRIKFQFAPHRENNVLLLKEAIFECCKQDAQIYRVDKLQEF